MSIKHIPFWVYLLVVAGGFAAYRIYSNASKAEKAGSNGKKSKPPIPVKVYCAAKQIVNDQLKVSGSISASEDVEIRAEVQAKVEHIFFKDGSRIKKGDLLITLTADDLRATLSKLEIQQKTSAEKYERDKKLNELNAVSKELLEASELQLASVKADIKELKARIAKYELRAPFSGTIGLRRVSEGSIITTSQLIATLQNTSLLFIDFSIPEIYIDAIKTGNIIHFTTAGSPKVYSAKISAVEPKIDPLTRTLLMRAIYNNASHELFPGSYANIVTDVTGAGGQIYIPTQAVIPELKSYKVYVVSGGKAIPHKVTLGLRTDEGIVITSGLEEGDSVITTGIMQLKPKADVKVIGITDLIRSDN